MLWGLVTQDGVEDDQGFAHAGGGGDLAGRPRPIRRCKAWSGGWWRTAPLRLGIDRAVRTLARPPLTMRRPRIMPETAQARRHSPRPT